MSSLKFCAVLLLVLAFVVSIRAQTNSTATPTPTPSTNTTTVAPTATPMVNCATKQYASLGQRCVNPTPAPAPRNESIIPVCALGLVCSMTTGVCELPSLPGSNCTTTCSNSLLPTQVGLQCVPGVNRCGFYGLQGGQVCFINAQCNSGNCVNGVCVEAGLGQNCTTSAQCGFNRYCNMNATGVCMDAANLREPCGMWSAAMGSTPIPCKAGFSCVFANATSPQSFCQANVPVGQKCEAPKGAATPIYAPACDMSGANLGAFCDNGTCVQPGYTGQACTAGFQCGLQSACVNGKCAPLQSQPTCNTQELNNVCNPLNQVCTCANLQSNGTCTPDQTNPINACGTQLFDLQTCLATKCNNAPYTPGDGSTCDTQCRPQVTASICCTRQAQGPAFIVPPFINCAATPAPTSVPTGTAGPVGPTPTPTPKRSGAATVSMSFVAVVLAVVAMCF